MILLTTNNAKERCRTCLRKLLKDEEDPYDVEISVTSLQRKFADINSNKELQEMLEKYLPIQWEVDFYKNQMYPQYVCMECLKHLQSFETFRNKAMDSSKKLYRIFNESSNIPKIELNDEGLECKADAEKHSSDCAKDIFNLFLKDSLMETEAIILDDPNTNNDSNNMDPDPFQNTQKQDHIRKTRVRRNKNKSDSMSNSKMVVHKLKKSNSCKENESIKNKLKPTLLNNKKGMQTENDDETLQWDNITFQDPDDDSSDNEVLSKKIIHSNREVKKRKEKQSIVDSENKLCSPNNKIELEDFKADPRQSDFSDMSIKNGIEFEKNCLESIKIEVDSEADVLLSDVDLAAKTDTSSKSIKVEKKKRHYILNSGRKKGLANKYKCDQCQHKFGHKLTLEAHIRKVHEGQKKAFKCQLCDKAYSFIGGLSTHIRDVHERKQDSYDCSVPGCDKKYSNFITLQRHVRFKHLNMETPHQYVCEQCGATFKQSSNLRYHMKTRHPTEEDLKRKELLPKDRLECEECKKSFHSQYTLKYHKLRVHADEKKFECKICGRRVAKQFMLDSHMLVHSDQKMACKFCGREFVRKYQVEAHIRAVHQKLKPFQCPHCSESFASRKTLRHHIYIHTGEKPYVCDICGQAYRQPTCLKNHRKIHDKAVSNNEIALTTNRSFRSSFVQNNDVLSNAKNIVLK